MVRTLLLIKIFVCRPGIEVDKHFSPINSDGLFNYDTFETKETIDCLFEPVEDKCAPYGLVLDFFNGSHFEQTINKWNSDGPFFEIGTYLPEAVLKMCNLTSKEWSKLTIESTSEHNQKVLKDKSKKTHIAKF